MATTEITNPSACHNPAWLFLFHKVWNMTPEWRKPSVANKAGLNETVSLKSLPENREGKVSIE
jgi:hypothetical protein